MAYPPIDQRQPQQVPTRGTFGYERGNVVNAGITGRSILVIVGAIVVSIGLVAFFASPATDGTSTNTIPRPAAQQPIGQAPVAPAR